MNINFTLIVQACNFFIAYIVIRWLFLKPAVEVVEQERSYEHGLHTHIATAQSIMAHRELEKKAQWQKFQQQFSQNLPHVTDEKNFVFKKIMPALNIQTLDLKQSSELEQKLTASIIKRIERVDA